MKKHLLSITALLIIALIIIAIDVHIAQKRDLFAYAEGSGLYGDAALADRAYATGHMPRTAFYPPMLTLVMLGIRRLGVPAINMIVFNSTAIIGGFILLYAVSYRLLKSIRAATIAVAAAIIDPYVIWTFLINRDTASEFLIMSLLALVFLAAWDRSASDPARARALIAAAALCGVALMLTRTTGFFVSLGLLLAACVMSSRPAARFAWGLSLCGFLLAALAFCAVNKVRAGQFSLATSGGFNLYLGNHPNYLDGHPKYDIDVFLPDLPLPPMSEAAQDDAYKTAAMGYIRRDPVSFLYRLIVKSEWYWFSPEKIPNYTVITTLDYAHQTIHLGKIENKTGLIYLIYRLIYMPFFLLALWLIWQRKLDRRFTFLIIPMLMIWPITAVTFPDTRFKLNAELLMLPAVVAAWNTGIVQAFLLRKDLKSVPRPAEPELGHRP